MERVHLLLHLRVDRHRRRLVRLRGPELAKPSGRRFGRPRPSICLRLLLVDAGPHHTGRGALAGEQRRVRFRGPRLHLRRAHLCHNRRQRWKVGHYRL